MSCRTTTGGSVSVSLAKAVTGLSDKEITTLFHSLKREARDLHSPSEFELTEWRNRQFELVDRMRRMGDTKKDSLRTKLFRTRGEPVPDGATFYAWSRIEARARQEVALQQTPGVVDLAPPGSQADLYDLGEDGRPTRVWYASYGSNLHRDRFMAYIEGGQPEGSVRTYDGCTDTTPPTDDIPIRYAGVRAHFALTSRVWRGGIAFIDDTADQHTHSLGRAYDISVTQFDEVVAQENGLATKDAGAVPLDEVLNKGRAVTGNGPYETIIHIGDYKGAPVLTFTAPFDTNDALTRAGTVTRSNVTMPVMTNKPSPAYLRMIGSGLNETFGMDEVQQADYLRGCPGGDRYSRKDMVSILRGEDPTPPRPATPINSGKTKEKAKQTSRGVEFSHSPNPRNPTGRTADQPLPGMGLPDRDVIMPVRSGGPNGPVNLPPVEAFDSFEHKRLAMRQWEKTRKTYRDAVGSLDRSLTTVHHKIEAARKHKQPTGTFETEAARIQNKRREARRLATQAEERFKEATRQPTSTYYNPNATRSRADWQREHDNAARDYRQAEDRLADYEARVIVAARAGDDEATQKTIRDRDRARRRLGLQAQRIDEIQTHLN